MKYLLSLLSLFVIMGMTPSLASAKYCQVYVSANQPCVNGPIPQRSLFNDSDGLAQINPTRCFLRALDYHRWCGYNGDDYVYTYYHNGNTYTSAAGNNGAADTFFMYVYNDLGHPMYQGLLKK